MSIGVCHRTISIEGSAIISSEQYLNKDNTKSIMRSGNPQQLRMRPKLAKRKNIEGSEEYGVGSQEYILLSLYLDQSFYCSILTLS